MSSIVLLRRSNTGRHKTAAKKVSGRRTSLSLSDPGMPQLLESRFRQTPFVVSRHLSSRRSMKEPPPVLPPSFLRAIFNRICSKTYFLAWSQWMRAIQFQKIQDLQRRILFRVMNRYLSLGFQKWLDVSRCHKQDALMRSVLLRLLRRKLSMAWVKWRELIKVTQILSRFLERMLKISSAGLLLLAFKRWRLADPQRPEKELVPTAPRQVLGYCDCVYRLGNGLHCRCSKEKHLSNRLRKLRMELDTALVDGEKEECLALGWPSPPSPPSLAHAGTQESGGGGHHHHHHHQRRRRRSPTKQLNATRRTSTVRIGTVPTGAMRTLVTAQSSNRDDGHGLLLPVSLGDPAKITASSSSFSSSAAASCRVSFNQSVW
jgi:hypothetical protein